MEYIFVLSVSIAVVTFLALIYSVFFVESDTVAEVFAFICIIMVIVATLVGVAIYSSEDKQDVSKKAIYIDVNSYDA